MDAVSNGSKQSAASSDRPPPTRDTQEENRETGEESVIDARASPQASASPAWDEGLTPEERADAKRRYKNWKGVERWRRRKQAQREANQRALTTTAGASPDAAQNADHGPSPTHQQMRQQAEEDARNTAATKEALAGVALGNGLGLENTDLEAVLILERDPAKRVEGNEWSEARRMLFEFSKLGKVKEAKLKSLLDSIASFAMIPHGYQRHKDRIVRLAEEVLNITRKGWPTTADVAQRFLQWGINFNDEWDDSTIPNIHQVMRVFAGKVDHSTFVKVPLQNGQIKTLSLRQLSQMDEVVHTELYVDLVQQILRAMPQATTQSPEAEAAKKFIARNMKQASMVASGYVIGRFVSFTGQRATRKHFAVPIQGMMYAASALGLQSDRCRELWRVYDLAQVDLRPLLERNQGLEQQLDALLVMHDISSDGSYHSILMAVEHLMQNFEEQFNISYFVDLKCSHELLTPLEVGLIAAAQVPKLTSKQILAQKMDPYTRMSLIFECGAIPRF